MKQEELTVNGFENFVPVECKRRNSGEPMNFFKAYCDAMVRILRLTESELKVFLAMCTKAEFDTNKVDTINDGFRTFVIEATTFKADTIRHAIVGLCKKGFIKKVNPDSRDGVYMLNKDYVFRGGTWGKVTSITFSETHYIDGRVKRHVHADMEEDDTPFPESDDSVDIPEHLLL
jgi:hypothetical protein